MHMRSNWAQLVLRFKKVSPRPSAEIAGKALPKFVFPNLACPAALAYFAPLSATTFGTFLREFSSPWSHGRSSPRIAMDSNSDVGERPSTRDFGRRFHTMTRPASAG
jgi:hypothetical protein